MTTTDGTMDYDPTLESDWQEAIDWKSKAEEIEGKYKSLQSDYTRKSQELSTFKKAPVEEDPDLQALDDRILQKASELLTAKWLVSREEIESERKFANLIEANPELQKYEKAIKKIAESEGIAYEDIIQHYWFMSEDKLLKAKNRSLLWDREFGKKEKPISEMSPSEYAEWKKKNLNGWDRRVSASSF